MLEPRKPSRPIYSAALVSSLYQRLIGKALAGGSTNNAFKPRESMMLYVPLVQAKRKLVNIAAKMFLARMMVDADQAALENCENAFNSVGGHVVPNIFASAMVDSIMAESKIANVIICASFVGMQISIRFRRVDE